ncbi:MAG: preprotein translocase subunit SecE [Eubacteriales bacterium]|nr:preprotein translocase subunit SecE [Eubacteriales bacterium]
MSVKSFINKKGVLRWFAVGLFGAMYLALMAIPVVSSFSGGKFSMSVGNIVVEGILAAILVVVIVLAIRNRAKVSKVAGEFESEVKRVTWLSWAETKRSTVVVLIALIVCALIIGLLDLGLSKGILALIGLFS